MGREEITPVIRISLLGVGHALNERLGGVRKSLATTRKEGKIQKRKRSRKRRRHMYKKREKPPRRLDRRNQQEGSLCKETMNPARKNPDTTGGAAYFAIVIGRGRNNREIDRRHRAAEK